jgi:hypothetical protein
MTNDRPMSTQQLHNAAKAVLARKRRSSAADLTDVSDLNVPAHGFTEGGLVNGFKVLGLRDDDVAGSQHRLRHMSAKHRRQWIDLVYYSHEAAREAARHGLTSDSTHRLAPYRFEEASPK